MGEWANSDGEQCIRPKWVRVGHVRVVGRSTVGNTVSKRSTAHMVTELIAATTSLLNLTHLWNGTLLFQRLKLKSLRERSEPLQQTRVPFRVKPPASTAVTPRLYRSS